MEQLAIVARLKSGAEPRAADLIENGPPFDPAEMGFTRHAVYLSAGEVIFVFEGREVEWIVDGMVDDPFRWQVMEAMNEWRPLVDGHPRIGRAVYAWEAQVERAQVGSAVEQT
jgi:hypothetical protein